MLSRYSLSQRLVTLALSVSAVFLLLAAFILERSYSYTAQQAVYERMQLQIWLLLADAELDRGSADAVLLMPEIVQEGRFNQLESNLWAYVLDQQANTVWRSQSTTLLASEIESAILKTKLSLAASETASYRLHDGEFVLAQGVAFESESGAIQPFVFVVVDGGNSFARNLAAYRKVLWAWSGITLLGLMLVQVLALRWGLRPLRSLNDEIEELKSGEKSAFDGRYPQEIAPLTDNLNQLIAAEREQRERYRNTLGDLAHSLKTPLAVMRGELSSHSDTSVIEQQISRMDQIVAHQLGRAVLAANSGIARSLVDISTVVRRVAAAMEKVYADKSVELRLELPEGSVVTADESDMMEVFGNLIDNAFKFCRSRVAIRISVLGDSWQIIIEDDGLGISAADRAQVLKRGQRLDASVDGQGIGLSVVQEIIDSYAGRLLIDSSTLGGAKITVILAAQEEIA